MNYIDDVALAIWNELEHEDPTEEIYWPLYRNFALLALTVGTKTNREAVHDAWAASRAAEEPDHPVLIPYPLLTDETTNSYDGINWAILEVAGRIQEALKSKCEGE